MAATKWREALLPRARPPVVDDGLSSDVGYSVRRQTSYLGVAPASRPSSPLLQYGVYDLRCTNIDFRMVVSCLSLRLQSGLVVFLHVWFGTPQRNRHHFENRHRHLLVDTKTCFIYTHSTKVHCIESKEAPQQPHCTYWPPPQPPTRHQHESETRFVAAHGIIIAIAASSPS